MSVQDDVARMRRKQAQRAALAVPPPPIEPDQAELLLEDIRRGLVILTETVQNQPPPQMPSVLVDPPDLSGIIEAIARLSPGVTPDELGQAIVRSLPPPAPVAPSEEMERLVKLLAIIENNTRFPPISGTGGGTVGLRQKAIDALADAIDVELRATPISTSLDAATLAALESVDLNAATLAALETINAAQSGAWNVTAIGSATEATLAVLEKNSRVAEWAEIASVSNATATATRAAVAGQSHYITSITGSFDVIPTTGIRLDLREAGVNKYSVFVGEHTDIELPRPFKMTANTVATLVLGAGGIGATGLVTMQGYTV